MNSPSSPDFQKRQQEIIKRYKDEIQWYGQVKQNHRRAYQILQVCVIVFSSLTPILILIDQVPKPLQALPAALAGILTAILATLRFQDNYVRFGYTLEVLKSELFKYETQGARDYGPDVDHQKALERFVDRMEEILMAEVADWRQAAIRKEERATQQQ